MSDEREQPDPSPRRSARESVLGLAPAARRVFLTLFSIQVGVFSCRLVQAGELAHQALAEVIYASALVSWGTVEIGWFVMVIAGAVGREIEEWQRRRHARKRAEDARQQREDERQRQAEYERQQREDERQRQAEYERQRQEYEAAIAELDRLRAENEELRKAAARPDH